MKRTVLLLGLAMLLVAAPAFAFGTKDVVKMSQNGVPDDVIITKIENSSHVFRLSADDIAALRDDGVSDDVIRAMLKTEGREAYDNDYGYPYYSYPYYGGYYYPRSSFSLGLRFGGGYHSYYPYYRGYYYQRRYTPNAPYSGSFGTTRYRGSAGSRSGSSGAAPHTRTR